MPATCKRAAVGPHQGGDGADEGGLAGAVRAEQGDDLAGLGDEIEPGEGLDAPEALGEAAGLDDGGHGSLLGSGGMRPPEDRTGLQFGCSLESGSASAGASWGEAPGTRVGARALGASSAR